MAILKAEALVLRTRPFRSSSLIVTLFSRQFGKLQGIVKGVRREGEMRGAVYELFTCLEVVFYEKLRSDLHLVSEGAILESHDAVRTGFETIAYASYFSELCEQLTELHDPHPNLFDLLCYVFRYLPSLEHDRLARLFELKLFNEIGWVPYLERCVDCGSNNPANGAFSPVQGAFICALCLNHHPDAMPLSPAVLEMMRFYIARKPEEAAKYRSTPQTDRELALLLKRFLDFRLHRPLKTREFILAARAALA